MMNCFIYFLDLWWKGERFKIFYNGDYVIGYNEIDFFDYGNYDYINLIIFLFIENWYIKEIIVKIFELNELDIKIVEEYYVLLF